VKSKTVLVTGGAGFIGSHLVDKLVERGYQVRVIDDLSLGKRGNINPRANFCSEDIKKLKQIKPVFEGVDCVFHLAARPRIQPSIINPDESFTNNLLGTHNVLVAAKKAGVKKFIYSGSSSVYGDQSVSPLAETLDPRPKNPYALHKLMSEQLCRQFTDLYNFPTVCLRYFNVYGERQPTEGAYATVVGIFLQQKASSHSLTVVGDGTQRRDFTHVSDVVEANILAMESAEAVGQIINIGTGKNYSINEVAGLMDCSWIYISFRPGEVQETLADISKARKILGFRPTMSLKVWIQQQLKKMV